MSKREDLLALADDALLAGRRDIAEQAIAEAEKLDISPAQQEGFGSKLVKGVSGSLAAQFEVPAQVVTGLAGASAGGLAGLASAPFVGTDSAADISGNIQNAMTYEPRTEMGKKGSEALGGAMASPWNPLNIGKTINDYYGGSEKLAVKGYPAAATGLDVGAQLAGGAAIAKLLGVAAKAKVARDTNKFEQNELLRSQNSVKDESMRRAQELGLSFPPSSMQGTGIFPRTFEGLSGKAKTEQRAVIKNQPITDAAARRDIGLADDVPLTPEATSAVAKKAYQTGYEPIKSIGNIATDPFYKAELDDILARNQGGQSFPLVARDEIGKIVTGYRANSFNSADAIDHIRMLREDANANFIKGENALARTQKDISKALENQVERHLEGQGAAGQAMLDQFRDSRKLIAKSKTVEKAIKDSSVDASKLAAMLRSGKPLEGDMRTIAEMADSKMTAGSMRMPQAGDANPFTYLDFIGGAGLGATVNPALMALPVARIGSREAILSRPVQKAMSSRQYNTQTAGDLSSQNARLLNNTEQGKKLSKALLLQQMTQENQ